MNLNSAKPVSELLSETGFYFYSNAMLCKIKIIKNTVGIQHTALKTTS